MSAETDEVMFEGALEAAPEKVWRALTIPEFLSAWLLPANNDNDGAGLTLDGSAAGLSPAIECTVIEARMPDLLRYRWREGEAHESVVTFELRRMQDGNTWLKLSQGVPAPQTVMLAANANSALLLAA